MKVFKIWGDALSSDYDVNFQRFTGSALNLESFVFVGENAEEVAQQMGGEVSPYNKPNDPHPFNNFNVRIPIEKLEKMQFGEKAWYVYIIPGTHDRFNIEPKSRYMKSMFEAFEKDPDNRSAYFTIPFHQVLTFTDITTSSGKRISF